MTRASRSPAGLGPAGGPSAPLAIYGIVAADDAEHWPGPEVLAVTDGELAALVGPLGEQATLGRAELERHDRVLAEVIARTTVIPMRFGMVMDGEEGVREALLRRHADELTRLLNDLRGHVQMTVKAFYVEDALLREVVSARPELARASAEIRRRPEAETRGQRIWLGERVAIAVGEQRERDSRALSERLSAAAAQIVVEPPVSERMALNAHLLVKRDEREALDAVVDELSAEHEGRLVIRYVGPLAPYSFADLALDAGEGATWG